jgi:hypothetical protein
VRGFNFILNFEKLGFERIHPILKKAVNNFLESAPPLCSVPSPICSARLLLMSPKELSGKWVASELDTFTYLCLLNRLGGRVTCDFTQFPVFPWLTADFQSQAVSEADEFLRDLTKPMGQIGYKRSLQFDELYANSEQRYYYGSHYMHFGIVLYFLFRLDPFCFFSLVLNKGWEHPNRIFSSLEMAWVSAAFESTSDVKEVIPHFFCVPELFENTGRLPLGAELGHVVLPKWSTNGWHFTMTILRLLESDKVSKLIHSWIDLIFGFKSRGPHAHQFKNLFHPLCYSNVGLDGEDEVVLEANTISIINFGQCAEQVFTKAHPQQRVSKSVKHLLTDFSSILFKKLRKQSFSFPALMCFADGQSVYTSNCPCCIFLMANQVLVVRDGSLFVVRKPSGEAFPYLEHLDLQFVSSICASQDGYYLGILRHDGGVVICRILYQRQDVKSIQVVSGFMCEQDINCCAISSEHFIAFAGSDGAIYPLDLGLQINLPIIPMGFVVSLIEVDEPAAVVIAAGESKIVMLSISGDVIAQAEKLSSVTSLAVSKTPGWVNDRFFVTGHADGLIMFWSFDSHLGVLLEAAKWQVCTEPILSLYLTTNAQKVIIGSTKHVFTIECGTSH